MRISIPITSARLTDILSEAQNKELTE